ncbi:MAG TPA: hypothetical protein VIN56_06555, partial [Candidatus Dormibacteraeota bacterium]
MDGRGACPGTPDLGGDATTRADGELGAAACARTREWTAVLGAWTLAYDQAAAQQPGRGPGA